MKLTRLFAGMAFLAVAMAFVVVPALLFYSYGLGEANGVWIPISFVGLMAVVIFAAGGDS